MTNNVLCFYVVYKILLGFSCGDYPQDRFRPDAAMGCGVDTVELFDFLIYWMLAPGDAWVLKD